MGLLDNILQGLTSMASVSMLAAILFGVVGGVVVGALPGLTSTMAIALLIPVTFSMEPQVGLAMLGGLYVASTYSGSLTAILLNIPGTPASIATLLDGHPMALKGQATKAIALATFASASGGIFSVFALLLIAPPLAEFSLNFGPLEYFLLAIFGVLVIISLSADSLIKGFIAGGFGLLFSTIGFHSLTGFLRFTNDIPDLYDGIPLVVSLIGLFSIPEVINMVKGGNTKNTQSQAEKKNPFSFFPEILKQKFNLLRSSVIGIIVGIIPGIGSSIGGFVAYDVAKKSSKTPEKFGKGSAEGLIAVESSNNAVTGGSLIPLLTLGIPGNPATALFLGGIMIHGMRPGAQLFTDNANVTYGFIMSLFISNLIFIPVGFILAKYCTLITKIPNAVMAPIILSLAVIGSYSIRVSLVDVVIMLLLGLFGYVLQGFKVPRAPLILGLVLGGMAESQLARSLSLVQNNEFDFVVEMVTRPTSLVILLICIYTLYRGITQHVRNKN